MKRWTALMVGLVTALFGVSIWGDHDDERSIVREAGDDSATTNARKARTGGGQAAPGAQRAQDQGMAEARARFFQHLLASFEKQPMRVRFPSEQAGLAPVYGYWAEQPEDPAVTASERERIGEMLTKHQVLPETIAMSCSAKICRSQITFVDAAAAARLHKLQRRADRRIYAGSDQADGEYQVALYWTLSDEATAEAPDPSVPEPSPDEFQDAYDPEPTAPAGG